MRKSDELNMKIAHMMSSDDELVGAYLKKTAETYAFHNMISKKELNAIKELLKAMAVDNQS